MQTCVGISSCSTAGVQATTRVTVDISDNTISDVYSSGGRGIVIGIDSSGSAHRNSIANCVSDGIAITSNSVGEVEDNTLSAAGLGVLSGSVGHLRRNSVDAATGPGIRLIGTVSGTIDDNTIRDIAGDGIYATDGFDFVVTGNAIETAGGSGMSFYADGAVTADGNTIDGCGSHGALNNLRISASFVNNVVRNTGISGIVATNHSRLSALNNVVENCVKRGIGVFSESSGEVRQNSVTNVGFSGLQATGTVTAVIEENVVQGVHVYEGGGHGILVGQGSSGQVCGNTVRQAEHSGITVYDTTAVVYLGSNTIREEQGLGVNVYAAASAYLDANTVEQNLFNGVEISDSASATIENTAIVANGGNSILLTDVATADLGGGGSSAGGNVLTANAVYAVSNLTPNDVTAFGNDWGTVCEEEVESQIWDQLDDPSLGKVLHELFNVAPEVSTTGSGTYECGDTVVIGGEVADANGDTVSYRWVYEGVVIDQGNVQTSSDGSPSPILYVDVTGLLDLGVHEFTLTAWDDVCPTHQATAVVLVELVDTTPPQVTAPPDIVAEQTSPEGAYVELGEPVVFDICDPDPVVTNDAPILFPPGLTIVAWTATDASGNSASALQDVLVQDTTAPEILSVWTDQTELWPPDHRMVPVQVYALMFDAADPSPTYSVSAVASNQPEDGLGDGDTSPDWAITGEHTVELRAERSAVMGDRIYTITITALDASSNASTATVTVLVPHDDWEGDSESW